MAGSRTIGSHGVLPRSTLGTMLSTNTTLISVLTFPLRAKPQQWPLVSFVCLFIFKSVHNTVYNITECSLLFCCPSRCRGSVSGLRRPLVTVNQQIFWHLYPLSSLLTPPTLVRQVASQGRCCISGDSHWAQPWYTCSTLPSRSRTSSAKLLTQ